MKALDQVARQRVAPVLKEAGFRRSRRCFWLESRSGDRAFVALSPFKLGVHDAEFFVDFAVLPTVYRDLVNRNGGQASAAGAAAGLWTDRLPAPGLRGSAMRHHWSFDLDDEETGRDLTTRLRQVLPGLIRLLDRESLLAYVRDPSTPHRELTLRRDAAVALLLAERGPSAELDEQLAGLRGDDLYDPLVAFIRERAATP